MSGRRSPWPVARPIASARCGVPAAASKWSRYISAVARCASASRRPASSSSDSASISSAASWRCACASAAVPASAVPRRCRRAPSPSARRSPSGAAAVSARSAQSRIASNPCRRGVEASSIISATASRRVGIPELGQRALEPGVRLAWRPRSCSIPAQATVSRTRSAIESAGTIRMLSSSASWLSANWPVAPSEPGERQQQLDALLGRRALGEQAQGTLEPPRCARRRALRSRFAGLAQDRDGCGVALAGRERDVVRARGGRGAARLERRRAALVRAQPPAARRRLVHGPCARVDAGSGSAWGRRCRG